MPNNKITRKNCLVRVKKEILGWQLSDCGFCLIPLNGKKSAIT